MHGRATKKFRPGLERFEAKQLPSATALTPPSVNHPPGSANSIHRPSGPDSTQAGELILSRITNPTPTNAQLIPPFSQVRVQTRTPLTGSTYNVLFVSVRNSTTRTFDASNGLQVKLSGGTRVVPVLTGGQQWKPGQVMVFYILSKEYYPLSPQVSAGFAFNLEGRRGVAIPGPSGIFLRVKYDPARFDRVLDHIVAFGPGSRGHLLGLPDTSIWEILDRKAR